MRANSFLGYYELLVKSLTFYVFILMDEKFLIEENQFESPNFNSKGLALVAHQIEQRIYSIPIGR